MLSFRSFIIRCVLSNGNLHIWNVVLKTTTLYLNIPSFSHNSQRIPVFFFLFYFVPSLQNFHIRSTLFGSVSFISFVHSLSYTSSSYSLTQRRASHVFYYNSISLPTDKWLPKALCCFKTSRDTKHTPDFTSRMMVEDFEMAFTFWINALLQRIIYLGRTIRC